MITLDELEALTGRKYSVAVHEHVNKITAELEFYVTIKPAESNAWNIVGRARDEELAERNACERILELITRMECWPK